MFILDIVLGSVLEQNQQDLFERKIQQDQYQVLQHGAGYCIKATKSSLY